MNFKILEVLICIIFLYLLLSLLVSTIQEALSSLLRLRSKELENGIGRMLGDDGQQALPADFYNHWMIRYLARSEKCRPSYISRNDFSKALIDIIKNRSSSAGIVDAVSEGLSKLPEGDTKNLLISFWEDSRKDITEFRKTVEGWFDSSMDRVSGWYKRRIQRFIFATGLVLVVVFNVDTFQVYQTLSSDETKRSSWVEMARVYSDMYARNTAAGIQVKGNPGADASNAELLKSINSVQEELVKMNSDCDTLGLGWSCSSNLLPFDPVRHWQDYLQKLLGWVVTALAITLGAPFWFDMLSKIMNIRNAGRKPDVNAG